MLPNDVPDLNLTEEGKCTKYKYIWLNSVILIRSQTIFIYMKIFLYASLAAVAALATASPTATIKNGTYVGSHIPSFNQDIFIGIPYAQVPTGPLRFRPPKALDEHWNGQKSAQEYGNSCYAFGPYTDNDHLTQSEDCLTLNIVRPTGYEGKKLPVGVWIRKHFESFGMFFTHVNILTFVFDLQMVEALYKVSLFGIYTIYRIPFSNLLKVVRRSLQFQSTIDWDHLDFLLRKKFKRMAA
jgi:hypothetical protein